MATSYSVYILVCIKCQEWIIKNSRIKVTTRSLPQIQDQWWIQDFPGWVGGEGCCANPLERGHNFGRELHVNFLKKLV